MENHNETEIRIPGDEITKGLATLADAIETLTYCCWCINNDEPLDVDFLRPAAENLARLKLILECEYNTQKVATSDLQL